MKDVILSRKEKLVAEGRDVPALVASVHEVAAGRILEAFQGLAS